MVALALAYWVTKSIYPSLLFANKRSMEALGFGPGPMYRSTR